MSARLPRSRDLAELAAAARKLGLDPDWIKKNLPENPPGWVDYPCVVAAGIGSAVPEGVAPEPDGVVTTTHRGTEISVASDDIRDRITLAIYPHRDRDIAALQAGQPVVVEILLRVGARPCHGVYVHEGQS